MSLTVKIPSKYDENHNNFATSQNLHKFTPNKC